MRNRLDLQSNVACHSNSPDYMTKQHSGILEGIAVAIPGNAYLSQNVGELSEF